MNAGTSRCVDCNKKAELFYATGEELGDGRCISCHVIHISLCLELGDSDENSRLAKSE